MKINLVIEIKGRNIANEQNLKKNRRCCQPLRLFILKQRSFKNAPYLLINILSLDRILNNMGQLRT